MTLYNIVMGIHVLGIIVMLVELVYVTTQKPSTMQAHIMLLLVVTLLMFVGYYIELKAVNIDVAYLGTMISYLGKPYILNCGLQIVCDFYNFKIKDWLYWLMAGVSTFVTLSVCFAPYNHLYYKSWSFDPSLKYSPLLLETGPLYYVYFASILVFFILSIYVIVSQLRKSNTKENRIYALYFGLMLTCGFLGYVVYLTDLSKGYDASIFGLMGSVLCLSILFFRYKIFDVLTVAKDKALENSPTGVIIVDENNKLSYANSVGYDLLNSGFTAKHFSDMKEDISEFKAGNIIYRVDRKRLSIHGRVTNTSFEFTDISEAKNYEARLEKEVKEQTERIESIQRKVVSSFASIVEARSIETGEHILRTSEYVKITVDELRDEGLFKDEIDDEFARCIVDVAPLHDVGKISVPDKILLKPGKLTDKEFEKMKIHAPVGAKIIETSMKGVESDDYVKMAMDVAKYHHERWDGKGYPEGLKKEEIPLCARIMALSDVYDALISERCYKKAFTKQEAMKIIKEDSGKHFDPVIAKAFLKAIKKLK